METLIVVFSLALLVAAALAAIAVWSPRGLRVRTAAVVLTAAFVPVAYLGVNEMLSQPKPMAHEWFKRHVDEATVLGVSLAEGKAIYLWLRLDDSLEPRFYVLPWRRELARRLEDLIDEAIEENAEVKIKNPFAAKGYEELGDLNAEIRRPPLPPMKLPPPPAQIFNPRERSI